MVRTLRIKGFLEQVPGSQEYRLGPRLQALVSAQSRCRMLDSARQALQALASRESAATLTFSQLAGGDVVVRLRISPDLPGRVQEPQGFALGTYSSASGVTTLAFAPEEWRMAIEQHHPLLEEAAHPWPSPEKLDAYLGEVRHAGFGRHPSSGAERLAVAVPVYEEGRWFAGAMGLSLLAGGGRTLGDDDLRRAVDLLMSVRREFGLQPDAEPSAGPDGRRERE